MPETVEDSSRTTPAAGSGAALLTAGGLAAAFAVASCCGLPFLLATAGLGTAWLTSTALFAAPYRSFLLAAAAVCLAGGVVFWWRQQRAVCVPGAFCARPVVKGLTLVGLLAGFALLYLGYTFA